MYPEQNIANIRIFYLLPTQQDLSGSASLAHLPIIICCCFADVKILSFLSNFLNENRARPQMHLRIILILLFSFTFFTGNRYATGSNKSSLKQIQRQHHSAETSQQCEDSKWYILQAGCIGSV